MAVQESGMAIYELPVMAACPIIAGHRLRQRPIRLGNHLKQPFGARGHIVRNLSSAENFHLLFLARPTNEKKA